MFYICDKYNWHMQIGTNTARSHLKKDGNPSDVSSIGQQVSWRRTMSKSWYPASNSEEFPAVAVRKYDEEEEGGNGGDEEESPEEPPVNSLRKHFPLTTDVVVPRLYIFLFQETLHYPHQIVLVTLPNSSVVH